jgi:TonB family protein
MEESMVHLRILSSTLPALPPRARAGLFSLLIHASAVTLLFTLASTQPGRRLIGNTVHLIESSVLAPYLPQVASAGKSGGSGGDLSPLPASRGRLPRIASRQLTLPVVVPNNLHPALPVEPTLLLPPDTKLPDVNLPQFGDPWAQATVPSTGQGCCGGIGDKRGHGIGPGEGTGVGPGTGDSIGGIALRSSGASRPLVVLYKVEPEYSDDARKVQLQGTVVLRIEVDERGLARNLKVIRPLGLGLDERALDAVKQWRFRPAYRNGQPTVATAIVEVSFRLL